MQSTSQHRRKIQEEASHWAVRLQFEGTSEAQAEFDRWVRQGPAYLEEFLLAKATFTDLDGLHDELKLFEDGSGAVVPLIASVKERAAIQTVAQRGETRRARKLLPLLAAALLVGVGIATFAIWRNGASFYATAVGGQEIIKLSDGSIVALNTDSAINVQMSERNRSVSLSQGEALFTVARDPKRPFVVTTGRATIQAVGTAFNVRADGDRTRVAVVEGSVKVTSATLHDQVLRLEAGDEAEVTAAKATRLPAPNVPKAVAWRDRKLVFIEQPAGDIAAEFNRYNSVKIHIEGERLRSLLMGGTFDADDPSPLIQYLSREPGVSVKTTSTEILVRQSLN